MSETNTLQTPDTATLTAALATARAQLDDLTRANRKALDELREAQRKEERTLEAAVRAAEAAIQSARRETVAFYPEGSMLTFTQVVKRKPRGNFMRTPAYVDTTVTRIFRVASLTVTDYGEVVYKGYLMNKDGTEGERKYVLRVDERTGARINSAAGYWGEAGPVTDVKLFKADA